MVTAMPCAPDNPLPPLYYL